MKHRYLLIAICIVLGMVILSPISVMAQTCTQLWQNAQAVMSDQCTDANPNHTACYAHAPLATIPDYNTAFDNPGEIINITSNLKQIIGYPSNDPNNLGGFAYLKVIPAVRVEGVVYGSSISMVAFGRTEILEVESANNGTSLNANEVCRVSIRNNSTTFGGTYLRAIPDPNFSTACVTPGCTDKDNLLHFALEGETLSVIGQDSTGNSYLVADSHVTGWIPSSPTYIDSSDCAGDFIPQKPNNIIQQMQAETTNMPVVTSFRLRGAFSGRNQYMFERKSSTGWFVNYQPI